MLEASLPVPAVRIEIETDSDAGAVDALVLAAFGPGRFAKTAERLRERAAVVAGFVARDGERLLGSVRLWSIRVGDTPALFLGPIAVAVDHRGSGLGADLVRACIAFAADHEAAGILLIGDPPYFERFGFRSVPDVRLTGPVDQRRLMWLGGDEPAGLATPV